MTARCDSPRVRSPQTGINEVIPGGSHHQDAFPADEEASCEKNNFNGFFIIYGYCQNTTTGKENSRVKRIHLKHNDKPL
jgi:hypothetical protein